MLPLTILLVVGSLEVVNSRDSDNIPHLQPDFGPGPNVTKVQVDSTAFLHCNILHLQEDHQVGWKIIVSKYFKQSWTQLIFAQVPSYHIKCKCYNMKLSQQDSFFE